MSHTVRFWSVLALAATLTFGLGFVGLFAVALYWDGSPHPLRLPSLALGGLAGGLVAQLPVRRLRKANWVRLWYPTAGAAAYWGVVLAAGAACAAAAVVRGEPFGWVNTTLVCGAFAAAWALPAYTLRPEVVREELLRGWAETAGWVKVGE